MASDVPFARRLIGGERAADAALAAIGVVLRLRRPQHLQEEGGEGALYYLRKGLLAAVSESVTGSRQIICLCYPGDVLSCTLGAQLPGFTTHAVAASEVVRLPPERVRALIKNRPDMAEYLLARSVHEMERMAVHGARLGLLAAEERVASLFVELGLRLGRRAGTRVAFEMPLRRVDVAEYLLLNPDTVSRIVARFRRDGLISRSRREVAVSDWTELCRYSRLADALKEAHDVA